MGSDAATRSTMRLELRDEIGDSCRREPSGLGATLDVMVEDFEGKVAPCPRTVSAGAPSSSGTGCWSTRSAVAGGPGQLILFVTPSGGGALDDALRGRIRAALRKQLSPRHVPDVIEAVAAIPHTLTGKKLETPIKQILLGRPADEVISRESVSDFAAITVFESFAADLRGVAAW
jgi:hypothetical protein